MGLMKTLPVLAALSLPFAVTGCSNDNKTEKDCCKPKVTKAQDESTSTPKHDCCSTKAGKKKKSVD